MVELRTGDILRSDAEALVNTVNCVGVMGRGVAFQFKKAFPDNFKAYLAACKRNEVTPGRMFVQRTGELGNPRYIINFPTKRHWRGKSRMVDIESGLAALVDEIRRLGIRSIAIPPLGSGLGGLDWADVRPRIEAALAEVPDVNAIVFEPHGAPAADVIIRSRAAPKMTAGRAALIGLMDRYRAGLLDPFISLLEVHKLMYFLQAAGQNLSLRFVKAPYGPYAENLRHVLNALEGHYISGYPDGGDAPTKPLELLPGSEQDAARFLSEDQETRERFDRVAQLVDGFESPFGLELLATVHWVMNKQNATTSDELVRQVYAWNQRKRSFTPRQILLAQGVLHRQGWLQAPSE